MYFKIWLVFGKLIFTTLWANSADDKLVPFFLIFPENRIWHFMQTVSEILPRVLSKLSLKFYPEC